MKNENKNLEISKKIDNQLTQIFSNSQLQGFEKAIKLADGITGLRELLSNDYMQSIMKLQNSKLGFRTDRKEGYDVSTVKECLIEAVLLGLQPVSNMMNIIAGNMYVTKEGFGHLLNQENVDHTLRFGPIEIDQKNKVARLDVQAEFTHNGKKHKETIPVSAKWNAYSTDDNIQGKATRKARAWIYNRIHNTQIGDGDVAEDVPHVIISDEVTKEKIQELLDDKKELVGKDGKPLLTQKEIDYTQAVIDEDRTRDFVKAYNFLNSKEE